MNWKRAIWMAAVVYVVSFVVGLLIATVMGVDLGTATEVPDSVWYAGIVFGVIIMAIFTLWFFKGKNTHPSLKEGLFFGLAAVVVGFILDLVFIIPYIFATDAPSDVTAYYANPLFWATLVLILATASVVGWMKGKK